MTSEGRVSSPCEKYPHDGCGCPLDDGMPFGSGRVFSEPVSVTWYEHDCEWITKYCDEHHARTALVPRDVLAQYVTTPARTPSATDVAPGSDPTTSPEEPDV